MKRLGLAVVVVGILYTSWPYYGAYSYYAAVRDRDADAVIRKTDFIALQASFKGQLSAYVTQEMEANDELKKNPFAALAAVAAPAIVGGFIDAYVTPPGIRKALSQPTDEKFVLGIDDVRYAFFATPTSFRVIVERKGDVYDAMFKLQDWGWELVDLILPLDTLKEASEKASIDN